MNYLVLIANSLENVKKLRKKRGYGTCRLQSKYQQNGDGKQCKRDAIVW